MKCFEIYVQGDHRWLVFGQDDHRQGTVVDTNQVVATAGRTALLMDPGGVEIFPAVMGALVQEVDLENLRHLFLSHQDPDVGSALALWRQVTPATMTVHAPALWIPYVSHYDAGAAFTPIADEGGELALGGPVKLRFLPAHYLHSAAAFCVYDPVARVLFTGDIGASAPTEASGRGIWVTDFQAHIPALTGFHRRYLGCPAARDAWVEMIARLPVDMIVPQHGLALRGPDVQRFLDWFKGLSIATGLEAYRGRFARA